MATVNGPGPAVAPAFKHPGGPNTAHRPAQHRLTGRVRAGSTGRLQDGCFTLLSHEARGCRRTNSLALALAPVAALDGIISAAQRVRFWRAVFLPRSTAG